MKTSTFATSFSVIALVLSGCVGGASEDDETPVVSLYAANDTPPPPDTEPPTSGAWPGGPTQCAMAAYSWTFDESDPPWTLVGFGAVEWASPDSGGAVEVPDAQPGDTLIVDASFSAEPAAPSGLYTAIRLLEIEDTDSEAIARPVPGTTVIVGGSGASAPIPVSMSSMIDVVEPGPARIVVQGRVWRAGDAVRLQASGSIRVLQLRCGAAQ